MYTYIATRPCLPGSRDPRLRDRSTVRQQNVDDVPVPVSGPAASLLPFLENAILSNSSPAAAVVSPVSPQEDLSLSFAVPKPTHTPDPDLLKVLQEFADDPKACDDPHTSLKQQQLKNLSLDSQARAHALEVCIQAKEASEAPPAAPVSAVFAEPAAAQCISPPEAKLARLSSPDAGQSLSELTPAASTGSSSASSSAASAAATPADSAAAVSADRRRHSRSSRRLASRHHRSFSRKHASGLHTSIGSQSQIPGPLSPSQSDTSHSSSRTAIQRPLFLQSPNASLIFGGKVHSLKLKGSFRNGGRGISYLVINLVSHFVYQYEYILFPYSFKRYIYTRSNLIFGGSLEKKQSYLHK